MLPDLAFLPDWIDAACKVAGAVLIAGSLLGGITNLCRRQGSLQYCDTVPIKLPCARRRLAARPIRHTPADFASTPTTLRLNCK
ncbi:hypothetical protein ACFL2F_01270, partial [Myxococcota bacterium]